MNTPTRKRGATGPIYEEVIIVIDMIPKTTAQIVREVERNLGRPIHRGAVFSSIKRAIMRGCAASHIDDRNVYRYTEPDDTLTRMDCE